MILVRPWTINEDYDMLCSWWKAHGWTPVLDTHLPASGVIAYSAVTGECLAAGFAYMTDTPLYWLEFLVSSPNAPALTSAKALGHVVESLIESAEAQGRTCCFSSSDNPSLIRFLQKRGFEFAGSGITHLIRNKREGEPCQH